MVACTLHAETRSSSTQRPETVAMDMSQSDQCMNVRKKEDGPSGVFTLNLVQSRVEAGHSGSLLRFVRGLNDKMNLKPQPYVCVVVSILQ